MTAPSRAKYPRVENSSLEGLRASLKEEITSEVQNLFAESQRELLQMLKTKTSEYVDEEEETILENETRSFYTPTESVRINSTQPTTHVQVVTVSASKKFSKFQFHSNCVWPSPCYVVLCSLFSKCMLVFTFNRDVDNDCSIDSLENVIKQTLE